MMYIFLPSLIAMITPWIVKMNFIWVASMSKAIMLSTLSLKTLNLHSFTLWHKLTSNFAMDSLSAPLIILSTWLVPMSLLASMKTMNKFSPLTQRTFMSLMFTILLALLLTFSALELSLFYMAFEATLLPTLSLISRWGAQKERYQASIYFIFFTLTGSLPLLMVMIALYNFNYSSILPTTLLFKDMSTISWFTLSFWSMFCFLAFIMKMPMYGFHLWLPKAHVEAPIAGSMILAAILLKLGGYGLIRTMSIFFIIAINKMSFPLITFCIWGALMTSIICLRQTDLKALIAYSSVGHMSMVASGMFTLSLWGLKGALILMIAHGLISSSLFCLAKLIYERKKTRTLAMTRGFKLLTPLLTMWWIMTCVSKLGLPPTPKLMGELLIMSSIIDWNTLSAPIITMATVFSAMYSLLMFQKTNSNTTPSFLSKMKPISSSEHILILLHLLPMIFLILSPSTILIC